MKALADVASRGSGICRMGRYDSFDERKHCTYDSTKYEAKRALSESIEHLCARVQVVL